MRALLLRVPCRAQIYPPALHSCVSCHPHSQAGSVGCPEATWLCEVVQQLQQLAANCDYGEGSAVRKRQKRCTLLLLFLHLPSAFGVPKS